MSNSKKYQLSKIKQLIDLNGDKVNFESNFLVKSTNNAPFEAIVIDQEAIDSQDPIVYKKVDNGELSGNIVWKKNIYKNYLLLLRSSEPCECEVTIDLKEVEAEIPPPMPPQSMPQPPPSSFRNEIVPPQVVKQQQVQPNKNEEGGIFRTILIIVAIVLAGFAGYWVYKNYFQNSQNNFYFRQF